MADSIPSSCINCQAPYYKQGEFEFYVTSYFCATCQTRLTKQEWKFMSHLETFVWVIDSSDSFVLPHEDLLLSRIEILKKAFTSLRTKAPREQFVSVLNDSHLFGVLNAFALDFVELLEEYDQLTKEQTK